MINRVFIISILFLISSLVINGCLTYNANQQINSSKEAVNFYKSIGGSIKNEKDISLKFFYNSIVRDIDLKYLVYLPQIEILLIYRCSNITDEGVVYLKYLKRLSYLNFSFTKITDKGLEILKTVKINDTLVLCYNKISNKGLINLYNKKELKKLEVCGESMKMSRF